MDFLKLLILCKEEGKITAKEVGELYGKYELANREQSKRCKWRTKEGQKYGTRDRKHRR